jgi:predicted RNase H-like nuclease (RuvC/YqgF family)
VRELERGLQRAEEELEQACYRLGELFRAKPVRSFAADPEVKNRLRRAAQAEKSSEKYRKQVRRLEAAIQIDALDGQVRAMREKIEKVTREIRAREQEVRELESRIAGSEGERERLVKVRGPEQDLLELEEPEGDRE